MNWCLDATVWTIIGVIGVVAAAVSLYLSVGDRSELLTNLADRRADLVRRQLGAGMVRRMERGAVHAIFTEAVRLAAMSLFLAAGIGVITNVQRVCLAYNPIVWALLIGFALVVLNTLHQLYTRLGNNFAEGPTDATDAIRDAERDAIRDPGRDEGRDLVRDEARDDARDDARDKEAT